MYNICPLYHIMLLPHIMAAIIPVNHSFLSTIVKNTLKIDFTVFWSSNVAFGQVKWAEVRVTDITD